MSLIIPYSVYTEAVACVYNKFKLQINYERNHSNTLKYHLKINELTIKNESKISDLLYNQTEAFFKENDYRRRKMDHVGKEDINDHVRKMF